MSQAGTAAGESRETFTAPSRSSFTAIGKPEAALAFGMFAVFVFLVLRNVGLYPWIFSDEYQYSQASRLVKAATTSTPLYIYYWVYRLTRHAGTAFLEAARLLNALFFVGAAPFVYRVAGRVASKWVAVLIAVLSLADPINTYTAYFMPEGMFFFVFWWMTWFLLCRRQVNPIYYGSAAGLLLTVLVLVKVNAIFLIPAIMAFLVYANYRDGSPSWLKSSAVSLCSFLLAFAVARLALGWLFAGRAGLHVLGMRYGALAHASLTPARLSLLTSEMFGVLRGHALGLALLFAVPLVSMVAIVFRSYDQHESDKALSEVAAYAFASFLTLLVVVAYFTASVFGESPYESLGRLHMRYYNFLFPLLLIVVAGQLTIPIRRNRFVVWLSVAGLIVLIALSFTLLPRLYTPSLIDSPELYSVTLATVSFYGAGILGVVSLLVWGFSQRRGAQLVLFVILPATVLIGAVNGNSELRKNHLAAAAEDNAGVFAHNTLDPLERPRLVVVGSEPAGLYHVLFYVDDPRATAVVIAPGAPFDPMAIPADHDWVLLLGDHAIPSNIEDKIVGDGFVLLHLPARDGGRAGFLRKNVYFSHPFRFGLVDRIDGAPVPELFGRWSDGKQVRIEMSSPLPRRFDVRLMARAFGPNAQLPFTMQIGEDVQAFRLSSELSVVALPFSTDGTARTITINIPQPTSPRQLGQGTDDRQLGIALMQMSIESGIQPASEAAPPHR